MGCQSKIFGLHVIRKNPSLIPLVATVTLAICAINGFLVWSVLKKEHQMIKSKPHKHDNMDLLNPYRCKILMLDKHALDPKPKLHEVYKLMKAEEKKRKIQEETKQG